jgi:membrane protein
MRRFMVRLVRIVTLIFKGFRDDECSLHSSSLTFSTLMAIVPVLALSLVVARGFGDPNTAKDWVKGRVESWTQTFTEHSSEQFSGDATVAEEDSDADAAKRLANQINRIVESGFEKVDNINFARLGAAGSVLLIWMVISVLGHVESSFNSVWGVRSGRPIWRKFTDYLSVLMILPVLMIAAASLPVMDMLTRFLDDNSAAVIKSIADSGVFKNFMVIGMTSLAFAFLIMFMPNTMVKLKAGMAGGIVTAVLFIIWMTICAWMQVGVARSSKIYGGFAVVPILLTWVYVSWQIIFFGAEVAFAVQHYATYKMEQRSHRANFHAKLLLALAVVTEAARSMIKGTPPLSLTDYAKNYRIPVRFLNALVDDLESAGYMARITEKEGVYVLMKAPSVLRVTDIVEMIMNSGAGPESLGLTRINCGISKVVRDAAKGVNISVQSSTIENLVKDGVA